MSTDPEQPASELNDLSELEFSFEENDAASASPGATAENEEAGEQELDIDSLNIQGDSEDSRPTRNAESEPPADELNIDGFNIEGASAPISETPAAPAKAPTNTPSNGPQAETREYYVESLGQTLGPMGLTELTGMADSGALAENDRVKKGERGNWIEAGAIKEVSAAFLLSTSRGTEGASTMSSVTARRLQSGAGGVSSDDTGFELSNSAPQKAANDAAPTPTPPKPTSKPKPAGSPHKKRRRGKKDELLEEIFSEVFTEEGTVRDDVKSRRAPTEASQAPATGGLPAETPPPAPVAASAPATKAPPKPFVPPRPKPKAKSGAGFSMPPPKIMGIAGGAIAILAAIGFFFGDGISLPVFAPNPTAFIEKAAADFRQLASGTITEDQWKAYSTPVKKEAGAIIKQYSQIGALDSEQTEQRKAVAKILTLAGCKFDDKEKQTKHFEAFEELMED